MMPAIESTLLGKILGLLTTILIASVALVFRKLFKHDTTLSEHATELALCTQREDQREHQREEDNKRRDGQRREMLGTIKTQHETILRQIDRLAVKVDDLVSSG